MEPVATAIMGDNNFLYVNYDEAVQVMLPVHETDFSYSEISTITVEHY